MAESLNFDIMSDITQAVEALRIIRSYSDKDIIPELAEGIEKGVMYTQALWIKNASGVQVNFDGRSFKVNRITGQYVRSIQRGMIYPMQSNPYWGRIESTCPYAIAIEMGRKARSGQEVRAAMLKSPKAKTAKDGSRYITIAFRHGIPGSVTMKPMPKEIYEEAKKLKFTGMARIGGVLKSTRSGGSLHDTMQTGRRTKITTAERPFAPYTWKSGQYEGMKRMGQKGHTSYITFRRISSKTPADSQAWAQPEIKPRPIAQATARQATPMVLKLVRDSLLGQG